MQITIYKSGQGGVAFIVRDYLFSTFAKFSKKLTILTPWYAHVRVRIRRSEMLVFRIISF